MPAITAAFISRSATSAKISLKASASAVPGDAYQLRIVSSLGTADVPLQYLRIVVLKPVPAELPTSAAPVITSLRINNGEAQTQNRMVGLTFEADKCWFQWRFKITYAGHEEDFRAWNRRPTSWPVYVQLFDVSQVQTVCVQVQACDGNLSEPKCASIT